MTLKKDNPCIGNNGVQDEARRLYVMALSGNCNTFLQLFIVHTLS